MNETFNGNDESSDCVINSKEALEQRANVTNETADFLAAYSKETEATCISNGTLTYEKSETSSNSSSEGDTDSFKFLSATDQNGDGDLSVDETWVASSGNGKDSIRPPTEQELAAANIAYDKQRQKLEDGEESTS